MPAKAGIIPLRCLDAGLPWHDGTLMLCQFVTQIVPAHVFAKEDTKITKFGAV